MAHPKGLLIERAQKLGLERPEFDTAKTGPEHEPSFLSDVVVAGEVIGTGQGGSKREAEKAAAEEALAALDQREAGASSRGGRSAQAGGGRGSGRQSSGRSAATPAPPAASEAAARLSEATEATDEEEQEQEEEQAFSGPWPMFDDLLASVVEVAERRVSADLRGETALFAIRDFSLALYKELLADLGEVVEEDEEEEDED